MNAPVDIIGNAGAAQAPEPYLPVYLQGWWLDTVKAPGNEPIIHEENGQILARLDFVPSGRFGTKKGGHDPLQHLGGPVFNQALDLTPGTVAEALDHVLGDLPSNEPFQFVVQTSERRVRKPEEKPTEEAPSVEEAKGWFAQVRQFAGRSGKKSQPDPYAGWKLIPSRELLHEKEIQSAFGRAGFYVYQRQLTYVTVPGTDPMSRLAGKASVDLRRDLNNAGNRIFDLVGSLDPAEIEQLNQVKKQEASSNGKKKANKQLQKEKHFPDLQIAGEPLTAAEFVETYRRLLAENGKKPGIDLIRAERLIEKAVSLGNMVLFGVREKPKPGSTEKPPLVAAIAFACDDKPTLDEQGKPTQRKRVYHTFTARGEGNDNSATSFLTLFGLLYAERHGYEFDFDGIYSASKIPADTENKYKDFQPDILEIRLILRRTTWRFDAIEGIKRARSTAQNIVKMAKNGLINAIKESPSVALRVISRLDVGRLVTSKDIVGEAVRGDARNAALNQKLQTSVPVIATYNKDGALPGPFLFPDLSYTSTAFANLGARLHPDQKLNALLRPPGKFRAEGPDLIREIARYHADQLCRVNPEGPIVVGGYSAGVIPAYALAQELSERGREVPLFIALEGAPNNTGIVSGKIKPGNLVLSQIHNRRQQGLSWSRTLWEVAGEIGGRLSKRAAAQSPGAVPQEDAVDKMKRAEPAMPDALVADLKRFNQAVQAYTPERLSDGTKVLVIKAGRENHQKTVEKWGNIVPPENLHVEVIRGSTHISIVRYRDAAKTARVIENAMSGVNASAPKVA